MLSLKLITYAGLHYIVNLITNGSRMHELVVNNLVGDSIRLD